MPSFEIADCPTKLNLTMVAGTQEQTASVSCSIRNITSRKQTARIRIEPQGDAKPEWFSLAGALPTSSREIEQDFDASGTVTARGVVKVPPGTPAGPHIFRLRVISEAAPDTDFADGPGVTFDVAAWKEPEVKNRSVPWWAIAVAVAFVLIIGGVIGWLAWPKGLDPELVVGLSLADAKKAAADNGFPDVKSEAGPASGNSPQTVIDVKSDDKGNPILVTDPGVQIPQSVVGKPALPDALNTLLNLKFGVSPDFKEVKIASMADGVVVSIDPPAGSTVELGRTLVITYNDNPPATQPPIQCVGRYRWACARPISAPALSPAALTWTAKYLPKN